MVTGFIFMVLNNDGQNFLMFFLNTFSFAQIVFINCAKYSIVSKTAWSKLIFNSVVHSYFRIVSVSRSVTWCEVKPTISVLQHYSFWSYHFLNYLFFYDLIHLGLGDKRVIPNSMLPVLWHIYIFIYIKFLVNVLPKRCQGRCE